MNLPPLTIRELPPAPPLRQLLGPSFILLGLGLGSGEVILWPYLTSNFGLGIIWGAVLGLTFQFFMNMEIERYALARGESVFVGLARKTRITSFWFLLSTFIPWLWPGIAAASAKLFASLFGLPQSSSLAISLLVIMGTILTLGPVLYKTVEGLQKILIFVGVPSIFLLTIVLAETSDWLSLGKGLLGLGPNYFLLPVGLPLASFLAALAYAGAGGNLNLAQSFYIKEKGYGMGKYAGRITSLLSRQSEKLSLSGVRFNLTPESLNIFKSWWKKINLEHFIVFWATGALTILLLALLAYTTTYGQTNLSGNISFVLAEAQVIGQKLFPGAGLFFLLITGLTLFGTQLTVYDAVARILSENLILSFPKRFKAENLRTIYYAALWILIAAGVVVLLTGFTEPLALLTLAAVLNALAMFVHTGLTLWLNLTSLEKPLRPSPFRMTMMGLAFLFYGGFGFLVILDRVF